MANDERGTVPECVKSCRMIAREFPEYLRAERQLNRLVSARRYGRKVDEVQYEVLKARKRKHGKKVLEHWERAYRYMRKIEAQQIPIVYLGKEITEDGQRKYA